MMAFICLKLLLAIVLIIDHLYVMRNSHSQNTYYICLKCVQIDFKTIAMNMIFWFPLCQNKLNYKFILQGVHYLHDGRDFLQQKIACISFYV